MKKFKLVIPRWFYQNNLGDSFHSFFAPKAIKKMHPDCFLEVVTYGELISLMKLNPYVDKVTNPDITDIKSYDYWKSYSFSEKKIDETTLCLFAEWHPKLWSFWNQHFDEFSNHPTANLLTVNSLLQLNMTQLLFDGTNFHCNVLLELPKREFKTLGIVPSTKLAGRPSPHPGCDGKGFRFNGDDGTSWKIFVSKIKELDPEIKIIEYSYENFNFGDEHIPHSDWITLIKQCSRPKVVVLSDGGMHHVFNSVKTPVVLLGAQKINKPYFFKLQNAKFYEHLHQKCLNRCYDNIRNLNGWNDLSKTCDNSCQLVDSNSLAIKVFEDYYK